MNGFSKRWSEFRVTFLFPKRYVRTLTAIMRLPIAGGQTISQPYIVARETELLELTSSDRVLEIGAGSGYQTAILAQIARSVFAIERLHELAEGAHRILSELKIRNAIVRCFDGTYGWSEFATFRAIVVAAGAPAVPQSLVNQLGCWGTSGDARRR